MGKPKLTSPRTPRVVRPGAKPQPEGIDSGERWEIGRGDGAGLYLVTRNTKQRIKIADFAFGGVASGLAAERALIAAQAPRMYEALLDIVSNGREGGFFHPDPGNPVHRVDCKCGICEGLLALALAEGGGRCILCGCTYFDACEMGCAWVDRAQLICTAHPDKRIAAAKRLLAKGGR
jgi:hypothetical protein